MERVTPNPREELQRVIRGILSEIKALDEREVDYRPFKNNKLRLKKNIVIPQGINNYGMKLVKNSEQIS
jgi:hypothetical protein